jgi:deoxyadenosine/deoxycytidine kinase
MYLLEGNIGVGKSTFLSLIAQHCPEITVIQEPKENWATQDNGQSLLARFYADPQRWTYTIETLAMISRVKDHTREQQEKNPLRIMERSVYSGHYCFAKNGFANGHLSNMEWEIYSKWVEFLVQQKCHPPKGFIYLQAKPDICFARMQLRNRNGEEGLKLEYMQQIHDWHEKFLISKEGLFESLQKVPVLMLDCNADFANNPKQMQVHIEKINEFLKRTATS